MESTENDSMSDHASLTRPILTEFKGDNIKVKPPKPFLNAGILSIAFVPLVMLGVINFKFLLDLGAGYADYLVPSIIIVCSFLLTALCIYLPDNKHSLVTTKKDNLLLLFRDSEIKQEYNLDNIRRFISRQNIMLGQKEYKLMLEEDSGYFKVLFNLDGIFFSPRQWHDFAERLAKVVGKEYVKEIWVEDDEGKLHLKPPEEFKKINRRRFYILISFSVTLIGALGFNYYPSVYSLFGFGLLTTIINVPLSLLLFKNSGRMVHPIITVIVLFLKYSSAYVIFVLIIKSYSSS